MSANESMPFNLRKAQELQAKKSDRVKLEDLKKFAGSFKLHTPGPKDLVSLMAKDTTKQREILERGMPNAPKSLAKGGVSLAVTNLPSEFDTKPALLVTTTRIPASLCAPSPPKSFSALALTPDFAGREDITLTKAFSTVAHRPKPVLASPTKSLAKAPALRTKLPRVQPHKTLPEAHRHLLERKLGHIFEDPNHLWEALQAHGNGIKYIGDRKIEDGNKKLAMLGDCLIKVAILNDWFESGESRRTFLSDLRLE